MWNKHICLNSSIEYLHLGLLVAERPKWAFFWPASRTNVRGSFCLTVYTAFFGTAQTEVLSQRFRCVMREPHADMNLPV